MQQHPLTDPATGQPRWADQPTPPPAAPYSSAYQAPPARPPRRGGVGRWLIPIGTFVLGLAIGSVGSSSGGATTASSGVPATTATTATATPQTAKAPAAPAQKKDTIPGDGTYLVGTDVTPGVYKSGKPASGNCYWARLKDDTGSIGDIIANNNSAGSSVVTIRKTDRMFQTSGCETWVKTK